jgi:hypothetical protein
VWSEPINGLKSGKFSGRQFLFRCADDLNSIPKQINGARAKNLPSSFFFQGLKPQATDFSELGDGKIHSS